MPSIRFGAPFAPGESFPSMEMDAIEIKAPVGDAVGALVGECVGACTGETDGAAVGIPLGATIGAAENGRGIHTTSKLVLTISVSGAS